MWLLRNSRIKKAQFVQTSSQKAPHKSLAPQLVQWGSKKKKNQKKEAKAKTCSSILLTLI